MGITSAAAAERGIETTEFTYNLGGNGKSVILQTQGAAKVIAAAGGRTARPGRCWASTWSAPGSAS